MTDFYQKPAIGLLQMHYPSATVVLYVSWKGWENDLITKVCLKQYSSTYLPKKHLMILCFLCSSANFNHSKP